MLAAWATDVHLNFVPWERVEEFCQAILRSRAEVVLLGGDIAEAPELEEYLRFLEQRLERPIYFVLGNHDYYAGAVADVESRMRDLESPWLRWLPGSGVCRLTERTALVGHGGWGDARHGDFLRSPVVFSDYVMIQDLRESAGRHPLAILENRPAVQQKLQELGDRAADDLRPSLMAAAGQYADVLVLTHVPPFREAAWYRGAICGDDWLPATTCKALGDLIATVAASHPQLRVTVLCGHTHGEGEATPLPNVRALTQGAKYGDPTFRLLELD